MLFAEDGIDKSIKYVRSLVLEEKAFVNSSSYFQPVEKILCLLRYIFIVSIVCLLYVVECQARFAGALSRTCYPFFSQFGSQSHPYFFNYPPPPHAT